MTAVDELRDGVYVRDDNGVLRFHELGTPTHEELGQRYSVVSPALDEATEFLERK